MRAIDPRRLSRQLLTFVIALNALVFFGCGGPSPSNETGPSSQIPELTDEVINERINYARVRDIPEETGAAEPISWTFIESEPKEIEIVDRQVDGNEATVILNIKTRTFPGARNPRELAGQIRTEWRLETGWVLRKWEIVRTENISMKYKNLPKPPDQNSNR